MSELQKALAEQQKAMEATGQAAMSPHEYLYLSVANKPPGSQPNSPSRALVNASASSPNRSSINGSIVTSRIIPAPQSPDKTGNVNAIQNYVVTEIDAHPATGYPATEDAYMNNLPQELYAPKLFLAKHVTETLQLCLRVLERNAQERGNRLTNLDEALLLKIAAFGPKGDVKEAQLGGLQGVEGVDTEAEVVNVSSIGAPSTEPIEAGLREATY